MDLKDGQRGYVRHSFGTAAFASVMLLAVWWFAMLVILCLDHYGLVTGGKSC